MIFLFTPNQAKMLLNGAFAPRRFSPDKKFVLWHAVRFMNSEYTALSRIERGVLADALWHVKRS
jgi:hypothetical protein